MDEQKERFEKREKFVYVKVFVFRQKIVIYSLNCPLVILVMDTPAICGKLSVPWIKKLCVYRNLMYAT